MRGPRRIRREGAAAKASGAWGSSRPAILGFRCGRNRVRRDGFRRAEVVAGVSARVRGFPGEGDDAGRHDNGLGQDAPVLPEGSRRRRWRRSSQQRGGTADVPCFDRAPGERDRRRLARDPSRGRRWLRGLRCWKAQRAARGRLPTLRRRLALRPCRARKSDHGPEGGRPTISRLRTNQSRFPCAPVQGRFMVPERRTWLRRPRRGVMGDREQSRTLPDPFLPRRGSGLRTTAPGNSHRGPTQHPEFPIAPCTCT